MNSTGDRLRELIGKQEVSIKKFCEKNKLNYSAINNILNGERSLGVNTLQRFKEIIPELDANWLLFGEPISNKDIPESIESNLVYKNVDPGKEMLMKYLEDNDVRDKIIQLVNNLK